MASLQSQIKQIQRDLARDLKKSLKKRAEDYSQTWKEIVTPSIKSSGKNSQTQYKSTGETLDSIGVLEFTGTTATIGYDTSLIHPEPRANGWNAHMDTFGVGADSTSSSEDIPLFIEYGENSPYYSRRGVDAIGKTERHIEQNFENDVIKDLAEMGYEIG